MIRSMPFFAALLTAALLAPALQAGEREDACRARAEKLSGYRPRGLEKQVGGLTLRLSGSVALGVSRSRGPALPAAPRYAGEAHRERFEAERNRKRAARYRGIFDACMRQTGN